MHIVLLYVNVDALYKFETNAESACGFVPIGAQHHKLANLSCRTDMLADARTSVEVANSNNAHNVRVVVGNAIKVDTLGQVVRVFQLGGVRVVLFYQLVHAPFYFLLILSRGLSIECVANLTFLSLHMCIGRATAVEHSNHHLVKQMLGRMCRRELILIVRAQQ